MKILSTLTTWISRTKRERVKKATIRQWGRRVKMASGFPKRSPEGVVEKRKVRSRKSVKKLSMFNYLSGSRPASATRSSTRRPLKPPSGSCHCWTCCSENSRYPLSGDDDNNLQRITSKKDLTRIQKNSKRSGTLCLFILIITQRCFADHRYRRFDVLIVFSLQRSFPRSTFFPR